MSIGISLSPPSTDISTNLLSSLLGPKWWLLATGQAPTGAGSILAHMFSIFDIALLMYVSALLVYQATVGGMATAHEGTPLGKRYHSIWAPIRGPAAFGMLFPLPWAKGLALIQCIALLAVYWGIGVADDVWNGFVQEIPAMSGVIMPSQQSVSRDNRFVDKALLMATAQEYLIQRDHVPLSSSWVWRGGVNSGYWVLTQQMGVSSAVSPLPAGVTNQQFIAGLGTIEVSCSNNMQSSTGTALSNPGFFANLGSDVMSGVNWVAKQTTGLSVTGPSGNITSGNAQNNPVCQQEMTAVEGAMNAIYPIAVKIVGQNAQTNAGPVLPSEIANAVNTYQAQQAAAYNALNQNKQAALLAQTKAFANEASGLGWASSAFYYWTLNNINAASQAYLKMLQPKIVMPNMAYVEQGTANYVEPAMLAADAVINHYESSNSYVSNAKAVATIGSSNPNGGTLFSSSGGTSWMGGKVMNVVNSLDSGNPLANMMADGHEIILAGGAVAAGPSAAIAIARGVGAAGGFVAGMFVPGADATGTSEVLGSAALGGAMSYSAGKIAGSAARAVTAMSGAKEFAIPVGLFLVVEGAIIAYVIPSIPGVIMIFAVVGWIFVTLELLVAAPLWAAAHAYAEGEGFAPQSAQYGYSAAIGIVMRPVLLTFGFVIMFFMIFIIGHFVGAAMTIYMMGMNGFHLGIVGSVAVLGVIIGTIWGSMKLVMKLTTYLADRAPQYLGGQREHLGDTQEATHATNSGAGKAKELATGAYAVGARTIGQQRIAFRNASRTKNGGGNTNGGSETNAATNSDNIGGGETDGKSSADGGGVTSNSGSKNTGGSTMSGKSQGGIGGSVGAGFRAGQKVRSWITGQKPAPASAGHGQTPGSGGETGGKTEEAPIAKSGPSGPKNEQKDV